jgi:hypothetical protein
MDALEFLNSDTKQMESAIAFLTGDTTPERSFSMKAVDFLTMGHVFGEYGPEKEVSFDAEGKMTRADVPTGDPGFFQDPVTALAMGGFAGVKAAGGVRHKGIAAGREALGWLTGGGSEVPALAKAGVKGIVKAVETPALAETAAKRAGKEFAEVPIKMKAEQFLEPASKVAAEAVPRITPPEIVQPGAKLEAEAAPEIINMANLDSIIPEVKGGATGELPKYAEGSAINLERLNTTEDVRQFINERTKAAEKTIGKRTVTWDETRAQAEALGWDEKAIRKEWNRKGSFTAAEIDATRQTNLNAITELQQAIKDLPYDQTTLPAELRAKVLDVMGLVKVTSQAASESGRALNIHKRILEKDPAFKEASELNRVLNAIAGKGGKRTDELIGKLRELDFSDTAAVNRFVYNATKTPWQKISNGGFQLWLEGLLSNPVTHIVNTTSNALTMAYQYPERLLGAGIEAARAGITGTKKGIFFGETAQDVFAISKGLQDAVARFSHTMKYGEKITKLDYTPSVFPESVSKYLPTRALAAEDAFFKGFVENQELNRLAFRQAKKEGLVGDAFQDKITDLLIHPTEQMLNDAAKRGQYLTYQKEVGEVGRLIYSARDKVPPLKLFIPFVKTPLNIAKFALERTPLNLPILATRAINGDLKGAQLSEELAKPLMGTMLATTVYQMAEQGYITGATPKKTAERDEKLNTGWQPYSVKIGDKYYSFSRMEPLGSIMGMAAALSQIKNNMAEDEKFNLAYGIMDAIKTNIADKTFMQGLTNVIQAISDPGRYAEKAVKTLTGSIVPAVSGGIARSIDSTTRDIQGPVDTITSRIPIASETLPAKLTVWGEPVMRPGSPVGRFISPLQISQEKGSPIEKELLKLDLDIGYPSRKIGNIEMRPEEYWMMVKAAGYPAKKELDGLVQTKGWDGLSDYQKEQKIIAVVDKNRKPIQAFMAKKLFNEGRLQAKTERELRTIINKIK